VQADRRCAMTGRVRYDADRIAGGNLLARPDRCADRLDSGAQHIVRPGMSDHDNTAACHQTCIADNASAGGPNGRPGAGGQVDTAMSGQPSHRRRVEPPHHDERRVERRRPSDERLRTSSHWACHGRGETADQGNGQRNELAAGRSKRRGHIRTVPLERVNRHRAASSCGWLRLGIRRCGRRSGHRMVSR
jgi:hypothetical protein